MYLDDISGFITFLTHKNHTLQEILNHLNLVVLKSLDVSAVSISRINDSNELVPMARTGFPKEIVLKMPVLYNMDDKYPHVDAIKTLSTIWINTLPDWGAEYPLMKNFPIQENHKTYVTVPIFVTGTPVASLAVFSNTKLVENIETDAFLKTIGHILSMYIYRNTLFASEEERSVSSIKELGEAPLNELTERQTVILRLISEDRTNLNISQFLGYSESTIRQEIMRIFAKLGCGNRHQAAEIYKSFNKD